MRQPPVQLIAWRARRLGSRCRIAGLVVVLALLGTLAVSLDSEETRAGGVFTVNSGADSMDVNPGDGVCAAPATPLLLTTCTLRAAIQEANALPGPGTIMVPSGQYNLSLGSLFIDDAVTILGAGAASTVIEQTGGGAVLTIVDGPVQVRRVTITGASAGGIGHAAPLTLEDSVVTGNATSGDGGGIRTFGSSRLTLDNTMVSLNTADGRGGGIFGDAGTTLVVTGGTIDLNNASLDGGGIFLHSGSASLRNAFVFGNSAGSSGGGFFVGRFAEGSIVATDTIIGRNKARLGGGAYVNSMGAFTLIRSTLASNRANDGPGGGIYVSQDDGQPGRVTIENSTVSLNGAPEGGGAIHSSGGHVALRNATVVENTTGAPMLSGLTVAGANAGGVFNDDEGGIVTLQNSIVGLNTPLDCDGVGEFLSEGNNLDSDGGCGLTAAGDLPGMDPVLGSLAENGGPTQTHALLPGSPAINAGFDLTAPATDQRGEPREGQSDIGAFEFQGVVGVDGDGDGFDSIATGGTDCDDADPSVFPGAAEVADDGVDQDCDGVDLIEEEEEKEEPPQKKEEKEEPPLKEEEEEEPPPPEEEQPPDEEKAAPGALVLEDGGQFVFWQFGAVAATAIFGTVKIAWLWNPFAREWTSFVPVLGVVNFLVEPGVFLWVVSEGPQTIVVA